MTQYHTFTSYVIAGQVSYFYDNTYLGGGGGITGSNNFFLIGDNPPSSIPEPSSAAALSGLAALGLGALRRRPSRATVAA